MQAIRQIVDAERLRSFVKIPDAMRNTKVEVIILPAPPRKARVDHAALDSLCGSLRQYANPALISGEKTAWQMAVLEKAAQDNHDRS